jgi:hypothetical protein
MPSRRTFLAQASAVAISTAMMIPRDMKNSDGLPNRIHASTHWYVTVFLNGQIVYGGTTADRLEGWVECFKPKQGHTNFEKDVEMSPLRKHRLYGAVTFKRDA